MIEIYHTFNDVLVVIQKNASTLLSNWFIDKLVTNLSIAK
jgi:hypothetical protein